MISYYDLPFIPHALSVPESLVQIACHELSDKLNGTLLQISAAIKLTFAESDFAHDQLGRGRFARHNTGHSSYMRDTFLFA